MSACVHHMFPIIDVGTSMSPLSCQLSSAPQTFGNDTKNENDPTRTTKIAVRYFTDIPFSK